MGGWGGRAGGWVGGCWRLRPACSHTPTRHSTEVVMGWVNGEAGQAAVRKEERPGLTRGPHPAQQPATGTHLGHDRQQGRRPVVDGQVPAVLHRAVQQVGAGGRHLPAGKGSGWREQPGRDAGTLSGPAWLGDCSGVADSPPARLRREPAAPASRRSGRARELQSSAEQHRAALQAAAAAAAAAGPAPPGCALTTCAM